MKIRFSLIFPYFPMETPSGEHYGISPMSKMDYRNKISYSRSYIWVHFSGSKGRKIHFSVFDPRRGDAIFRERGGLGQQVIYVFRRNFGRRIRIFGFQVAPWADLGRRPHSPLRGVQGWRAIYHRIPREILHNFRIQHFSI